MQIRGIRSAGPGDDQARFLSDLRTLRDAAAIGHDELAARAHFPSDVLKKAESGPVLPSLPILTAYVRACDGDVPDWEERWRRLTSEIPEDPELPVRPAGASAAAVAGARAGVGIAPPEVHDPERIKAALRGGLARSGNGSGVNRSAGSRRSKAASGWGATPGWDGASDDTITVANGNHSPASWSREPFDTSVKPDLVPPAESAESADPFRWLPEEETVLSSPGAGSESADLYGADTPIAEVGPDTGSDHPSLTDPGSIESAVTEWAPRWDDAGKPAEGTDFWSAAAPGTDTDTDASTDTDAGTDTSTDTDASTDTDRLRAAAAAQTDDEAYAQTSWSAAVARTEAAAARAEAAASAGPGPVAPVAPAAATSAPATPAAAAAARYPEASEIGLGAEDAGETLPRTYGGSTGATGSVATTGSVGVTGSVAATGSVGAQAPSHQARSRQRDRLFPALLLVIIVIAALIGSALVLLLK